LEAIMAHKRSRHASVATALGLVTLAALVLGLLALATGVVQAALRTTFSTAVQNSGPSLYAVFARAPVGEVFRDGDWVAIPSLRDPGCIPEKAFDFNLLNAVDFRTAFSCALTVKAVAIWKNGPTPVDLVPNQAVYSGLGAVPVWFVHWTESLTVIADDQLNIGESQSLPSLRGGRS
jgi:membrane protease YdiL (CAAX protease family)